MLQRKLLQIQVVIVAKAATIVYWKITTKSQATATIGYWDKSFTKMVDYWDILDCEDSLVFTCGHWSIYLESSKMQNLMVSRKVQ